jgi:hypothetical protein
MSTFPQFLTHEHWNRLTSVFVGIFDIDDLRPIVRTSLNRIAQATFARADTVGHAVQDPFDWTSREGRWTSREGRWVVLLRGVGIL